MEIGKIGDCGQWKLWKMEMVENKNCGKYKSWKMNIVEMEIVENGNGVIAAGSHLVLVG